MADPDNPGVYLDDLIRRLRGVYVIPVNDGAGLLNGKDTYTRTFDVPAIHREAADALEQLRGGSPPQAPSSAGPGS